MTQIYNELYWKTIQILIKASEPLFSIQSFQTDSDEEIIVRRKGKN